MSYSLILHLDQTKWYVPKEYKQTQNSQHQDVSEEENTHRWGWSHCFVSVLQAYLFVHETCHFIPSHFLSLSFSRSDRIRTFYLKKNICLLFCLWGELEEGKRKKEEKLMRVQVPSYEFVCTQ